MQHYQAVSSEYHVECHAERLDGFLGAHFLFLKGIQRVQACLRCCYDGKAMFQYIQLRSRGLC